MSNPLLDQGKVSQRVGMAAFESEFSLYRLASKDEMGRNADDQSACDQEEFPEEFGGEGDGDAGRVE